METFAERAAGACRKLSCRGPHIRASNIAAEERERNARRLRLSVAREALRVVDHSGREDVLAVPWFANHIGPLSEVRREEVRENIEAEAREAADILANPERHQLWLETARKRYAITHAESTVSLPVINACTTCGGRCCRWGGNHAYVTAQLLVCRMEAEPERSPESFVEEYMDQLPTESVVGGCAFQGREGCVLPREIRGMVCNGYHCPDLSFFLEDHGPESGSVAVAMTDGNVPQAAAVMDSHGVRQSLELRDQT